MKLRLKTCGLCESEPRLVFLSITSHLLIIMLVCDVCSMQPGHKGVPINVSSTVPGDRMLINDNERNGGDC